MNPPETEVSAGVSVAVEQYRHDGDIAALFERMKALSNAADPEELIAATSVHHDLPEVVIPAYERVVAARPQDAQAMVVLANAYWLTGRGSDIVGALAARAIAADDSNRGAWHLWCLSESNPRGRVERWQQVAGRFPADQLARAALADNAASLAGAEHDPLALDLAVRTYEGLWAEASRDEERRALEESIAKLKGWKL
ncbi:MAG: hypothetical protein M3Z05_16380 [Gemmatimonadota bacterium]|nr:hypothetical protein [Gemmatimonadota bacterium]